MPTTPETTCPACGAAAAGNFCLSCGAGLRARSCPQCRAEQRPGARFCDACGEPLDGGLGRPAAVSPGRRGAAAGRSGWVLAGVGVLAVLALVLWLGRRETQTLATVAGGTAAAPFAAGGADDGGAPGGAPPDISAMSPRERFDRLYNRVMTAAEKGDQATAERFMPMALMAYGQLDSVDGDARFHAALLQLHSGNVAAGRALADTMLREQPGDLLGYVLLANAARWSKDEAGLRKVYGDFLAHYDAEMKAGRPEYKAHERTIAELRQAALDDRSK